MCQNLQPIVCEKKFATGATTTIQRLHSDAAAREAHLDEGKRTNRVKAEDVKQGGYAAPPTGAQ
jgi:hypothetical protein